MKNNKLLAVCELGNGTWRLGAGRSAHVVTDLGYDAIKKNVLGRCSQLDIAVTISEGYAGIFTFSVDVLKNDGFLRALLFGRATANYQFCATNAIVAQLTENYCAYCTKVVPETEFDFSGNCGYQLEEKAVDDGAKKTTVKQDKGLKIDYIREHRNVQAKCSLKHVGSNGKSYSHSRTNKSAKA